MEWTNLAKLDYRYMRCKLVVMSMLQVADHAYDYVCNGMLCDGLQWPHSVTEKPETLDYDRLRIRRSDEDGR